MSGESVTVYYDQKTVRLIESANVANVVTTNVYPKIFNGDEYTIVKNNIYSDASTSTKANLSGIATWSVKIGSRGVAAVIENANSASFNLVADWADADASTGEICFGVNASSSALTTALGTDDNKTYTCSVQGVDGDGDTRTVAQYYITVVNTPI